jgi:hypothetical protein
MVCGAVAKIAMIAGSIGGGHGFRGIFIRFEM